MLNKICTIIFVAILILLTLSMLATALNVVNMVIARGIIWILILLAIVVGVILPEIKDY